MFQEHVEGDLIKFYGVGPEKWFCWFYHAGARISEHPFSSQDLQKHTRAAAKCLGLEIFGGDAIVTSEGRIYLIDINSWPSFARFRNEASARIAEYLYAQLQR